jgi:curved DNA-binding protein CbpA
LRARHNYQLQRYSSRDRRNEVMAETGGAVERILACSNHFEVFDIPPVAVDVATITKLYRRLALKVHPDKCKHADGSEAFRRVAEAYGVLGDADQQRNYMGEFADIARNEFAAKMQKQRQQRAAAEARKQAAEAAAVAARAAEERAVREAARLDKAREKELRRLMAVAQAEREAEARRVAEEEAAAVAQQAREEGRRRAKALLQARRRLRNARSALQAAADELAADESAVVDDAAGAGCPLSEAEVDLLCARLSEAELERVLVFLLVGDREAAQAAAADCAAKLATEEAEAAALAEAQALARRKEDEAAAAARAEASKWSADEHAALVKGAKKQGINFLRVGGNANWETVAIFVNTATERSSDPRTGDGCRAEFRRLASNHKHTDPAAAPAVGDPAAPGAKLPASVSPLPPPAPPPQRALATPKEALKAAAAAAAAALRAAAEPGKKAVAAPAGASSAGVAPAGAGVCAGACADAGSEEGGVWTAAQQGAFEAALASHPSGPGVDPSDRWRAIGKAVAGKSAKQCLARYKAIAAVVKAQRKEGGK